MNANSRLIDLNFRLGENHQAEVCVGNFINSMNARGKRQDVIPFLEKLCADWPQRPYLKQTLAEQYQSLGRTQDALRLLDEAGELLLDAGDRAGAAEVIIDTSVVDASGGEVSKYDYFTLLSVGGTVAVEGSHDAANWAPIFMVNLSSGSTTPVAASVDGDMMGFSGIYPYVRVTSASAVTALTMAAGILGA